MHIATRAACASCKHSTTRGNLVLLLLWTIEVRWEKSDFKRPRDKSSFAPRSTTMTSTCLSLCQHLTHSGSRTPKVPFVQASPAVSMNSRATHTLQQKVEFGVSYASICSFYTVEILETNGSRHNNIFPFLSSVESPGFRALYTLSEDL